MHPVSNTTAIAPMSIFTSFPRLSLTRLYHSAMEAPKPRKCGAIQLKVLGCVERKRQPQLLTPVFDAPFQKGFLPAPGRKPSE
jgi:hypothetical protein